MDDRLGASQAAEHPGRPLGHLTVSREWLALQDDWLAARDHWELQDQQAAAEKAAPDAGPLRDAFAPILGYQPKTVLEWAEKTSLADYGGHLAGLGLPAVLWADAARIGLYAMDRRVMNKGGQAAAIVAAYHTREGLRSQYGAHPEGSQPDQAVLKAWDETTRLILGARSSHPAIIFSQLRLMLDAEISPIESDESTRSALAPLLAAAAAQHLDQA